MLDRIKIDPAVCQGRPTIRGMRITVDFVLKLLGDGYTAEDIVREYPELERALRPPVAQEALELTPDGKVLLHLRHPWRDGTRAILFEPTELLEKLAAMIPKPRINLLVYHGAFAPHARGRRGAVRAAQEGGRHCVATGDGSAAHGGSSSQNGANPSTATPAEPAHCPSDPRRTAPVDSAGAGSDPRATTTSRPPPPAQGGTYTRPKHYAWADLLRRTFEIDVLACPDCGDRLRLLATIHDPAVIEKILRHLGLLVDPPGPAPARAPAWLSPPLPGLDDRLDPSGDWPP